MNWFINRYRDGCILYKKLGRRYYVLYVYTRYCVSYWITIALFWAIIFMLFCR